MPLVMASVTARELTRAVYEQHLQTKATLLISVLLPSPSPKTVLYTLGPFAEAVPFLNTSFSKG